MSAWSAGKHPRDLVGRFRGVGSGAPHSPNPRLLGAQRSVYAGDFGDEGQHATAVENAYRRGKLFDGPKMTGLPHEQRSALEHYMYASGVNDSLRRGDVNKFEKDQIKQIDQIIAERRTNVDLTVYRGVSGDTDSPLAGIEPGDRFTDPGYSSTSLNPMASTEYGDHILEIEVPAGTNAAPASRANMAEFGPASEVLLGRGAVFEVLEHEAPEDKNGLFGTPRRVTRVKLVGYVDE